MFFMTRWSFSSISIDWIVVFRVIKGQKSHNLEVFCLFVSNVSLKQVSRNQKDMLVSVALDF